MVMPLKFKYRLPGRLLHRTWDPKEGTWTYSAGKHPAHPRTNAGKASKGLSIAPRMKAYWGSVSR